MSGRREISLNFTHDFVRCIRSEQVLPRPVPASGTVVGAGARVSGLSVERRARRARLRARLRTDLVRLHSKVLLYTIALGVSEFHTSNPKFERLSLFYFMR